jgi:pimeloyl-ACP methyl ester carboxylesterase
MPETKYAKSGDINIAYQIVGEGPDLVLVPGFVSHVEAAWDWPYLARFLHRLSSFSRLIVFDKRGTGLSDPMKRPPTLEERMDDIRAVMDAAGVQKAPLFGISEGGAMSIAQAAKFPDRVTALILYGSFAKKLGTKDYPWGVGPDKLKIFLDSFDEAWATGDWWDVANPSTTIDRSHRTSTSRRSFFTARTIVGWSSATAAISPITSKVRPSSSCPATTTALGWGTPTPCSMRSRRSSPDRAHDAVAGARKQVPMR